MEEVSRMFPFNNFELLQAVNNWMDSNMSWFPGWARALTTVLVIAAIGIWAWIKGVDTIEHDSIGIRTFFKKIPLRYKRFKGKDRKTIARYKKIDRALVKKGRPAKFGRPDEKAPGFHFMFPGAHKFIMINTLNKTYDLDSFTVLSRLTPFTGVKFEFTCFTVYQGDKYLWLKANVDIEKQLKAICNTELGIILRELGYEHIMHYDEFTTEMQGLQGTRENKVLTDLLRERVAKKFKKLGAKLVSIDLGQPTPITSEGWVAGAISSLKLNSPAIEGVIEKLTVEGLLNDIAKENRQSQPEA